MAKKQNGTGRYRIVDVVGVSKVSWETPPSAPVEGPPRTPSGPRIAEVTRGTSVPGGERPRSRAYGQGSRSPSNTKIASDRTAECPAVAAEPSPARRRPPHRVQSPLTLPSPPPARKPVVHCVRSAARKTVGLRRDDCAPRRIAPKLALDVAVAARSRANCRCRGHA